MSDSEGNGASPSAGDGVVKCSEVVLEVRARTDVTAMWVVGRGGRCRSRGPCEQRTVDEMD